MLCPALARGHHPSAPGFAADLLPIIWECGFRRHMGGRFCPGVQREEMGLLMPALSCVPCSGQVPRGCLQVGVVSGVRKRSISKSPFPVAGCTPKSVPDCPGNLQECLLGLLLEADRWMGKKYR